MVRGRDSIPDLVALNEKMMASIRPDRPKPPEKVPLQEQLEKAPQAGTGLVAFVASWEPGACEEGPREGHGSELAHAQRQAINEKTVYKTKTPRHRN